jgi:hypothetical protein
MSQITENSWTAVNSSDKAPQLICGPIVGVVTSTYAHILLEFDQSITNLEITLINLQTNEKAIISEGLNYPNPYRPKTYVFADLNPGHSYKFVISDNRFKYPGQDDVFACFVTPTLDQSELKMLGIAGWDMTTAKQPNRASQFHKEVKQADILVHCGNLIPIHSLFQSIALLGKTITEKVFERAIRNLYRRTLTQVVFREILSSISNIFLWGEEESLTFPEFATFQKYISPNARQIAYQVYREYFRSLRDSDDRVFQDNRPREEFQVCLGKTLLIGIDLYGNRLPNLQYVPERHILGNSQKLLLKESVKQLNPTNVIILCDQPIVSISKESPPQWPALHLDLAKIFAFAYERQEARPDGIVSFLTGGGSCSYRTLIERMPDLLMLQGVAGKLNQRQPLPLNFPCHIVFQDWKIMHQEFSHHHTFLKLNLIVADDQSCVFPDLEILPMNHQYLKEYQDDKPVIQVAEKIPMQDLKSTSQQVVLPMTTVKETPAAEMMPNANTVPSTVDQKPTPMMNKAMPLMIQQSPPLQPPQIVQSKQPVQKAPIAYNNSRSSIRQSAVPVFSQEEQKQVLPLETRTPSSLKELSPLKKEVVNQDFENKFKQLQQEVNTFQPTMNAKLHYNPSVEEPMTDGEQYPDMKNPAVDTLIIALGKAADNLSHSQNGQLQLGGKLQHKKKLYSSSKKSGKSR